MYIFYRFCRSIIKLFLKLFPYFFSLNYYYNINNIIFYYYGHFTVNLQSEKTSYNSTDRCSSGQRPKAYLTSFFRGLLHLIRHWLSRIKKHSCNWNMFVVSIGANEVKCTDLIYMPQIMQTSIPKKNWTLNLNQSNTFVGIKILQGKNKTTRFYAGSRNIDLKKLGFKGHC